MDFPDLVRLMMRLGPDVPLLSELTKVGEGELSSFLASVRGLSFTPVPANRFLRLKFQSYPYTRRSIKSDFSFLLSREGVEVTTFENFSGIPEAYDYRTDSWNYDGSIKATPLIHDFQYHGDVEPLDFSTLKSPRSITDILREVNRLGLVQGYVVDYGSREFVVDVLTLNPQVKEAFQYFPFIRFAIHLRNEDVILYLLELSVPEAHIKEVAEVLDEVRDEVRILFTSSSFKYSRGI